MIRRRAGSRDRQCSRGISSAGKGHRSCACRNARTTTSGRKAHRPNIAIGHHRNRHRDAASRAHRVIHNGNVNRIRRHHRHRRGCARRRIVSISPVARRDGIRTGDKSALEVTGMLLVTELPLRALPPSTMLPRMKLTPLVGVIPPEPETTAVTVVVPPAVTVVGVSVTVIVDGSAVTVIVVLPLEPAKFVSPL